MTHTKCGKCHYFHDTCKIVDNVITFITHIKMWTLSLIL